MVYLVRAVEDIAAQLAVVPTLVAAMDARIAHLQQRVEHHLTHKRKTISARVRNTHIATLRALGGRCPACDADCFDADGGFVGQVHHTEAASDARIESSMPLCAACNASHSKEPLPRAIVEAYHHKRRRLPVGPLFHVRRKAAR
jgi:hypothetical protein